MISRYSPLFYETNGRAAVFFEVSRTSETVPFIIDVPLPRAALRLRLVIVSNANQQIPSIDQSSPSKCRLICWLSTHRTLLLSLATLGFLFVYVLWNPRNFTLFPYSKSYWVFASSVVRCKHRESIKMNLDVLPYIHIRKYFQSLHDVFIAFAKVFRQSCSSRNSLNFHWGSPKNKETRTRRRSLE